MKKSIFLAITISIIFLATGVLLRQGVDASNLPQRETLLSGFPMQVGEWQGERHYLSQEILESLWADDYVQASYSRPGSPLQVNLLVPFYEYQTTRHTAHAPQSCLLGGGWELEPGSGAMLDLDGGISMQVNLLQKGSYRLLAAYCFYQRGRVITNPWANKFWLMWDAFTRRRTDGALVRVEVFVPEHVAIDEGYLALAGFIEELWPLLGDYVPE